MQQHMAGRCGTEDACWVGLRFIKDNLFSLNDTDVLKTSLCAPCVDGTLVGFKSMAVRGVLGVECPCVRCEQEQDSTASDVLKRPCSMLVAGAPGTEGPKTAYKIEDEHDLAGQRTEGCSEARDQENPALRASLSRDWEMFFLIMGMRPHHDVCECHELWECFTDSEPCAVCLESLPWSRPSARLQCQHRFHAACIRQWLDVTGHCPLCRKKSSEVFKTDPSSNHIFRSLSSAVSNAIPLLHPRAHSSNSSRLVSRAFEELLKGSSFVHDILKAAHVTTSCGPTALKDCFFAGRCFGEGILPAIDVDTYNTQLVATLAKLEALLPLPVEVVNASASGLILAPP